MSREPTKSAHQPPVVKSATAGFARLDGEAFPVFEAGWVWLVGVAPGLPAQSLLCYHRLQNCMLSSTMPGQSGHSPWVRRASVSYAGKRGGKPSPVQQDISLRLIELAGGGKRVLRLKGGDPFMFGRGGEESQALAKAKIPFRIVPGITAGVGGLAYAGIPSTHRDTNHSVIFLTGHDATGKMPANVNWQAIATASPVIVMYMAVKHLGEISQALQEGGRAPKDPVTIISNASLPHQQVQATTLDQAGSFVARTIRPPRLSSSWPRLDWAKSRW